MSIAGNWSTGKNSSCQSKTFDIEPCRLFRLLGTTFARNKATFGAGGLFATEPELVIVGCGTNAEKWSLSQAQMDSTPLKDCFLFEDNTVLVTLLHTTRRQCGLSEGVRGHLRPEHG